MNTLLRWWNEFLSLFQFEEEDPDPIGKYVVVQAINVQILHWREVIGGSKVHGSLPEMPLCQHFMAGVNNHDRTCQQCPVGKFTGMDLCRKTPYEEWASIRETLLFEVGVDINKEKIPDLTKKVKMFQHITNEEGREFLLEFLERMPAIVSNEIEVLQKIRGIYKAQMGIREQA